MPQCRFCGATCSESELLGGAIQQGCVNCAGSPDCARCEHPRRDHTGTFGGGTHRCKVRVSLDDGSIGTGRCACPGYSTEPGDEPIGLTEVEVPQLRPPRTAF
jgi:hypothetical protein